MGRRSLPLLAVILVAFAGRIDVEGSTGILDPLSVNYASKYLGAKVVDHHAGASGVDSLLTDSSNYMSIPCKASKKKLTIQLAREVEINIIALQNQEYFSGSIKDFTVVGTTRYPCLPPECMWEVLGGLQAKQVRDRQLFAIPKHRAVRYIRILWVSHYGHEENCVLSSLQVYGVDVLDNLAKELSGSVLEDQDGPDAADDDNDADGDTDQDTDTDTIPTIDLVVGVDGPETQNGTEHGFDVNGSNFSSPISQSSIAQLNVSTGNSTDGNLTSQAERVISAPNRTIPQPGRPRAKERKQRPPPPRNESATSCYPSDRYGEEYYLFGRGAICDVPTGRSNTEKKPVLSKATAAAVLVLPQHTQRLKQLQQNFTKLQAAVGSVHEKCALKVQLEELQKELNALKNETVARMEELEKRAGVAEHTVRVLSTHFDLEYRRLERRLVDTTSTHGLMLGGGLLVLYVVVVVSLYCCGRVGAGGPFRQEGVPTVVDRRRSESDVADMVSNPAPQDLLVLRREASGNSGRAVGNRLSLATLQSTDDLLEA